MALVQIQLRRDTTVNWTNSNPILADGEPAYDSDLNIIKIGDGVQNYLDLPIQSTGTYQGIYNETISSPSKTWNINHQLSTTVPSVSIFNDAGLMVHPSSITVVDQNNITVEFGLAIQGDIVVMGGDVALLVNGIEEAPNDGTSYSRQSLGWVESLPDDGVTEAKLETKYKSSSSVTGSDVDWNNSQVYTKTLTGNTVLTFSNLYIGVKDLEITGNFTLGLPSGFAVISGTYDGTVNNLIEVICTNPATPAGWVVISQES